MTFDLVGVGEPLVAFLPDRIGPLRAVPAFERALAGAECNVLIGATRLGLRFALASRVGDDEFGAYVVETLRGNGVDVSAVSVDPDAPTGIFFRERSALGHGSTPVYYRAGSAASRIGGEDEWLDLTDRCRLFLTTGITALLSESAHGAVTAALERAHRGRATTVFDPNLRRGLWGSARAGELLTPLLEHVDIYIGGEEETRLLLATDAAGAELAVRVAALGPGEVVIKRAHLGAIAVVGGVTHTQPPYPAALADPIGAGDAFAAGYLATRPPPGSTADALRAAAVCGSAVCAGRGDWETFPRAGELRRTLAAWPGPG
jgi:sugar/nucleoside kinase (ribokinase family)